MSQQLDLAKGRLYGADALGLRNLKLFTGSSRDVTPEQMAEQVNKSLSLIENGDFEEVDCTEAE